MGNSISTKHAGAASAGSRAANYAALAAPAEVAEAAWLAILIVAPLAMNPVAARMFEPAKLTALAPLAALLLAAWLAALPALRERTGGFLPAPVRAVAWALGAFLLCAVIATVASETPWIALLGNYFRREGLASWLIAGLVCAAMLSLIREPAQVERALDALLLGCVMPCAYALLQRYGYVPGTGDAHALAPLLRPGGTLGNPVFLGDYLLLLVPLTLARLLLAGKMASARRWVARLPWLALLGLQLWTLLLTQSRAPLAALLIAVWLLGMLLASLRRSRAGLLAAASLMLAALLALGAINLLPEAARLARTLPGVQRLVFTGGVDLSGASRLGIWQAGLETLRHAPWPRQLIGSGFDAAYFHYFTYLPPGVLRIEGEFDTIDRLHNEVLELAAGVGIAGLLCYGLFLAALLRVAQQALSAAGVVGGRAGWGRFLGSALAGGVCGAVVAVALTGTISPAAVGFGLGAGVAWAGALLWSVVGPWWSSRSAGYGVPTVVSGAVPGLGSSAVPSSAPGLDPGTAPSEVSSRQILVAALAAAVLGFWLDAQLSLPVMATRIIFFAEAALLAALAGGLRATDNLGRPEGVSLDEVGQARLGQAKPALTKAGRAKAAQVGTGQPEAAEANAGRPSTVQPKGGRASAAQASASLADTELANGAYANAEIVNREHPNAETAGAAHAVPITYPASPAFWTWGAGIPMVVALAAFFPAPFGLVVEVPAIALGGAKLLLLGVPLLAAWGLGRVDLQRSAQAFAAAGTPLRLWLFCVLTGVLGYAGMAVFFAWATPQRPEWVLGAPVLWVWAWLVICCAAYARLLARDRAGALLVPAAPSEPAAKPAGQGRRIAKASAHPTWPNAVRQPLFTALAVCLVAGALAGAWAELRADILVKLAGLDQAAGKEQEAAASMARASAILPGERQYRATIGTRRLQRALVQLQSARGGEAARFGFIAEELRGAEADLRGALALAPRDPWLVFGLANVLQFEGMSALRPLMGAEEGAAKSIEARRTFAAAQRMFPAQPTILRNWAQAEFDAGDVVAAYQLLDQMEALAPASEEPYVERIRMARYAGDTALAAATLVRAETRLDAPAAARLRQGLEMPAR